MNNASSKRQDWGLAVLRIVVGTVFLAHGAQKLFVYGFAGVAGMLGHMGIPLPGLAAVALILTEFLGGAALLLGLLTRWVTIPLSFTMLVAIAAVHSKAGFFLPNGFEYALTLLAANITFAIAGPGALAVDNWIAGRNQALEQPVDLARAA